MDNKKGLLLFFSVVIFSISIIIASKSISDAINNVGLGLSSINSDTSSNGSYELIVEDGWLYLYDTNNGQVWKKADDDNPDTAWQEVKHYTR